MRLYAGGSGFSLGIFSAAVETRHCVVRPLRAVREEIIPRTPWCWSPARPREERCMMRCAISWPRFVSSGTPHRRARFKMPSARGISRLDSFSETKRSGEGIRSFEDRPQVSSVQARVGRP